MKIFTGAVRLFNSVGHRSLKGILFSQDNWKFWNQFLLEISEVTNGGDGPLVVEVRLAMLTLSEFQGRL
jgi:hypothetical protein